MLPEIEKLLALQDRDQRIRSLLIELQTLPEEVRQRENEIRDSESRLETSKARLKETEIARKKLELEVQTKEQSIARYKQQQFETRKNEEYSALSQEISSAEKVIASLEDRELELMEEAEKLAPAVRLAEKSHAEEKTKLLSQIQELGVKKGNIEQRVSDLQSTRAALIDAVDGDLLSRFERLFKTKHGLALAELQHDVCTGCHMKVFAQIVIEVRTEKGIVYCPNCGRMLYLPQ